MRAALEDYFSLAETRTAAQPRRVIAQRDMYSAQRQLIETRLAGAANLVRLYQALGGGW